jgi:flagellar motor switch protein FliM
MTDKKVLPFSFKSSIGFPKTRSVRCTSFTTDLPATLSSSISAYLRTVVEIVLDDIAQLSYADFPEHRSDPTCYAVHFNESLSLAWQLSKSARISRFHH